METFEAVRLQKEFEQREENRITVPDTLRSPHPVAAATRQVLRSMEPDEYGMLKCVERDLFYIRVSPNSLARAVRILDAFLKACVARGFPVSAGNERERTSIIVNGESVTFSIEETAHRHFHRLTEEEKRKRAQGRLYHVDTYDYVPNGKLTLKLDAASGTGITGNFTDGAQQKLEERLNEVIVSMVHVAEYVKAKRREQEEWERRRVAENARRAEVRQRHREETTRVELLERDAENWLVAETVRRYIAAVEAAAGMEGAQMPSDDLATWLRWAHEQADRLDPLRKSPPSILDEEPPAPLGDWQFRW